MKRKEFYNLIWSIPLSNVANDFNLPIDQIRKICNDHKIPLPKPGYWKKLEYGKAINKTVLTEFEGEDNIDLNEIRKEYENSYPFRLLKRTKEIQKEHPKLYNVYDRLTKPHHLVIKAKADLSKKRTYKTDGHEQSVSTSFENISIEVSKSNVARMLRFIDAFVKLSEARGHEFLLNHSQTRIKINEELIPISFREKCNRKSVNTHSWPSTILVPNGKLSVKIAKPYSSTEWIEGKDSIEEKLPKIVAALELYSENEKNERERIKIYWEEQLRIQKIKDEEMARQIFEKEKIQILLKHSGEWEKTKNLKMFIDDVKKNYCDSKDNGEIDDWIKWAKKVEISLNPISCDIDYFLAQYDYDKSKILKRDLSK